jgi:hypothetical protein
MGIPEFWRGNMAWGGAITLQEPSHPEPDLSAEPKCTRCGHAFLAHDPDDPYEGACQVGAHESSTAPECDCEGYVGPSECSP